MLIRQQLNLNRSILKEGLQCSTEFLVKPFLKVVRTILQWLKLLYFKKMEKNMASLEKYVVLQISTDLQGIVTLL